MMAARRREWVRGGLLLLLIVMLVGCVKAQMHRPENIERGDGYQLAFIEFDDQGEPWAPSQLERTIELIENANGNGKRCAVVLFVHGWHNDASKREDRKRDNNVEGFKRLLDTTRQMMLRENSGPDEMSLIGVYLSWRGRSTDVKLLKPFTFYSRRGAGQRVAGVSTTEAILRVMATTKSNPRSAGVVIGHSFGGMIVERALMQALVGYTVDRSEEVQPVADLVVLVNPASQSLHAKNMLSLLKRNRLHLYHETEDGNAREAPFIVSVTSTGDTATGNLYPTALGIKGWTKKFRQYDPTDCSPVDKQKVLYKKTAGHNPVLHSHVVTTGEPIEPTSIDAARMELVESVNPNTGETRYSFPGQEYMFTIERLPWGYNDTPYWIMSVPPELIAGHSDIFTYNTLQLLRAIMRMSGALLEGGRSVLVRKNGVQPLELITMPDGAIAFLDLSRRFFLIGSGSRRPLGLSCLPPVIQVENAIGVFYEGAEAHVVSSAEVKDGKKTKVFTDLISFDFALSGSESVEWTEIKADTVFTAATGDATQSKIFFAKAGALYVADLEDKKPRAVLLSQFDESIELDKMKFDSDQNKIFGVDRDSASLYSIDLRREAPVPRHIAGDLGVPLDLDVAEGQSILVVDSIGKRVVEIDCREGDRCSSIRTLAAIPEFERPVTVDRGSDGTVWVGDLEAQKIFAFDSDGRVTRVLESFEGFSD